jgi:hypothetical protein
VHIPALPLGSSASFAVLAGSGVTNTGPTLLTGDLGSFPTPSITGLSTLSLNGVNQAGGTIAQQAKTDLVAGYDAAVAKASTSMIAADLGGRTLVPGIYSSASSIGLTGTVTLDGQGDQNAVFIFQAGSTLTTASASQVVLIIGDARNRLDAAREHPGARERDRYDRCDDRRARARPERGRDAGQRHDHRLRLLRLNGCGRRRAPRGTRARPSLPHDRVS